MGKPFSPERLYKIRRIRKARRLFKQEPMFAYSRMCAIYPGYSHEAFIDDLRMRKPKKKKKGKPFFLRYGRYGKMMQLIEQYKQTGDVDFAYKAKLLKDRIMEPYCFAYKVGDIVRNMFFSPMIPLEQIENLSKRLAGLQTIEEADRIVAEFSKYKNLR